ncbi:LysR family transcriptional regulator [Bradyrhizobium zhanjiangense]|uniref:LysR family transcriptional regulator n=2 Tax=Bradyrhizobium zhanjiangense TaxID=1325107 RepID=A0A4Q0QS30_9BRAD|nr:LysR family transcriptional regulator [Bradyrhizobium zhanjiangense]
MNIKQLRFFLQIAELGSVTRAATLLHIAQPALSRHIRQLEEELGVALFQRSDRGVALTSAGMLLRDRAVGLLQHVDRVRQEVRDDFNEPSGEVTVAMPPSMLELVTMPSIARYRERHPGVLLRVIEGISGVLNAWSMVQLGKADLAVVTNVEPLATLESTVFLQEPLCLIGPRSARLDPAAPVALDDVATKLLIVPGRPNSLRLILETAMAERKFPLDIAFEGNSPTLIMLAVEAGLGFATLPFCSAYRFLRDGRVSLAPIRHLDVSWAFVQSREQPLSTAGKQLKATLRETIASQIASGDWALAKLLP